MMGPERLSRWGGLAHLLCGLLLLSYWFGYVLFLPYGELDDTLAVVVLDPQWTLLNALGAMGAACGLLGLPAWYWVVAAKVGRRGLHGFLLSLLGGALLLTTMIWDAILWLPLARRDPDLLRFDGPIYTNHVYLGFFATAGLLWSAGYVLLGYQTARAARWCENSAWAVVVGAPLFALGSLAGPWQAYVRTPGMVLFALGAVGIGRGLIARSRDSIRN